MLEIKLVDEASFEAVIALKVAPEDQYFVAPNVRSLADAWLYRENNDVFPHAIFWDGEVIGFLLMEIDLEENYYLIWRIMIDQDFQGQGYGRKAITCLLDKAKKAPACKHVEAHYVMGNERMAHLLADFGFQETGQDGNEVLTRLTF